MDNNSTKKAQAYFQSDHQDLQMIMAKVKELETLSQHLKAHLEPNILRYCQVGLRNKEQLVLFVANSSIATEIRLKTPELIRKFKLDPVFAGITSIQCKIYVKSPAMKPVVLQKMQPLSTETAQMMQDIALSLEDPQLREIMCRIAKHTIDK